MKGYNKNDMKLDFDVLTFKMIFLRLRLDIFNTTYVVA